MSVSSVRVSTNYAGIGTLLGSPGVQHDLDRRAQAVADAALGQGITVGGVEGTPGPMALPVEVVSSPNTARARARVVADHPAALRVEAKYRLLVGALDAARG